MKWKVTHHDHQKRQETQQREMVPWLVFVRLHSADRVGGRMNEELTKRLVAELIAWGVVIGCCSAAVLVGVGLALWSLI